MSSQGHQTTFEHMYRDQQPAILREAVRLTGNASDAWDLCQETFTRAFESFESFAPGSSGHAWLRTILTRLYIDRWRKQARFKEVSIDGLEVPAPAPDEPPLWSSFSAEELREAIHRLPPARRSLLKMHVYHGHSYAALARQMRVPVATVGTRLLRTRARLRRVLLSTQQPRGQGAVA
jgi:RNA polymerase sigma-70 factor, ECF subfamily